MGVRQVSITFPSAAAARQAVLILNTSNHSSLIDPNIVVYNDRLFSTGHKLNNGKHSNWLHGRLKVFRCPLDLVEGDPDVNDETLPVDPHYAGLFLGDGHVGSTKIASSSMDPELEVHLRGLVVRLNDTVRPEGARPCKLVKHLRAPAGTWLPGLNVYSNYDAWDLAIVRGTPQDGPGYGWNPVRDGLEQLNMLNYKNVPAVFSTASPEARLALLAGMIDSDGFLDAASNRFRIKQSAEHLK
jgi:hypothetical protein